MKDYGISFKRQGPIAVITLEVLYHDIRKV
jgi:hypothetical protein